MSIYAVSDFSFNIGTTDISQQYVPLVKQDVPWGINSTYIYKAPTLANQFNVNNKHLVIENQCLSGNIVFKTKDSGRIIINDLSVGRINGLPYSGSGVGVGLTANSVNSSHIIDGAIVRSKLSELTTNLIIYNSDTSTTTLSYTIKLNTAGTVSNYFSDTTGGIGIGMTHSLRVCIPSITTQIGVKIYTDNKTVTANQIYSGAIQAGTFIDDMLVFTLDPAGYDNIQIGFVVVPS